MQQETCKMATVGDSPAKYAGQPWTVWAENVPLKDDVGEFKYQCLSYRIYVYFEKLKLPICLFKDKTCTLVFGSTY